MACRVLGFARDASPCGLESSSGERFFSFFISATEFDARAAVLGRNDGRSDRLHENFEIGLAHDHNHDDEDAHNDSYDLPDDGSRWNDNKDRHHDHGDQRDRHQIGRHRGAQFARDDDHAYAGHYEFRDNLNRQSAGAAAWSCRDRRRAHRFDHDLDDPRNHHDGDDDQISNDDGHHDADHQSRRVGDHDSDDIGRHNGHDPDGHLHQRRSAFQHDRAADAGHHHEFDVLDKQSALAPAASDRYGRIARRHDHDGARTQSGRNHDHDDDKDADDNRHDGANDQSRRVRDEDGYDFNRHVRDGGSTDRGRPTDLAAGDDRSGADHPDVDDLHRRTGPARAAVAVSPGAS